MERNQKRIGIFALISLTVAVFIGSAAIFQEEEKWQTVANPVAAADVAVSEKEPEKKISLFGERAVPYTEKALLDGKDVELTFRDAEAEADEIAEIELMSTLDEDFFAGEELAGADSLMPDASPVFLQLQYLPSGSAYIYPHEKKVNGLALGYYLPQQEINGVSFALCHMFNAKKSGFSASLLDMCADSDGVSFFVIGGSVVNRGFSMGLWNMTENNRGMQLGLVNREENNLLLEYDFKPQEKEDSFGVQAGLFNYSDARGVQFGLWNVNPNSWIKYFPIFNICF